MNFRVYDPTGTKATQARQIAPVPHRLAGLRLGVLDNGKEQADVLLRRAATLLENDAVTPSFERKPSFSRVAPDDVIDRLAMCDIVITGLGG